MPFVSAFLLLIGILSLVAWQTGLIAIPWTPVQAEAPAPVQPVTPAVQQPQPKPVDPPASEDRPSPMPSEDTKPAAVAASIPATSPAVSEVPQDVTFSTDPPGAVARLDGADGPSCSTPCQLSAKPGTHALTITLDGYQIESREVRVDAAKVDVPAILLRSAGGTLMLTSDPSGADVVIDGRSTGMVTPVRLSLSAGTHKVTIEKNGLFSSSPVEIQDGALKTLKLSAKRQ